MKKAISFSLWGGNPVYITGAIRNAEYIKNNLPEWDMVLWYDKDFYAKHRDVLVELEVSYGVHLFQCPDKLLWNKPIEFGCFWRFRTFDIPEYDIVIFRDADSRISPREMAAVDEWIKSDKALHVIRDHPYHAHPHPLNKPGILGGLWGLNKSQTGSLNMGNMIANFYKARNFKPSGYASDQECIFPLLDFFRESVMIHDEVGGTGHKFPLPRNTFEFCGERIDQTENYSADDRKALANHLASKEVANA